jgi:transposase
LFETRIIAEAQIKTDKVDARILADLLRGKLVPSVHIVGRETRHIQEVLRQRCFFVRQRTMLRNRIHRLLGAFCAPLTRHSIPRLKRVHVSLHADE